MMIRLSCCFFRSPLLLPITSAISHKKRLIKRRKIRTKKLPVSHQRLIQLKKHKSMPMLQREAQIRQRLQHQPNINRNVNQIIQQLFFPDLRMQDAMSIESSFKIQQLEAQAEIEQLVVKTQLDRLLRSQLNSELLQTYESHKHELSVEDLCRMVGQMGYNTRNLEDIRKKKMAAWEKYAKKAKDKKPENPLRFLDDKDVQRHAIWKTFEKDLQQRLENCEVKELDGYLKFAHQLSGFLGLIPFFYYDSMIKRLQKQEFSKLSVETQTQILKLICNEWRVKLPQQVRIQQRAAWREKLSLYGAQLIAHIVHNVNPVPAQAIGYIIRAGQMRQQYLKPSLLFQLQPHILKALSSLTFEQSVDLFLLYYRIKKIKKRQPLPYTTPNTPKQLDYYKIKPISDQTLSFLQFVKFDILRKLPTYRKFKSVMELIKIIHDREVKFGKTALGMGEFTNPFTQASLKQMKQHKLSGTELMLLLRNFFMNRISSNDFYEMVAVELTRKEQELGLEEVFQALFVLTLKKIQTTHLKDIAMRRALKQYKNIQKQLVQQRTKYLPTDTSQQHPPAPQQISQKQLQFQNSLILFLWSYLKSPPVESSPVDLDGIFSLYPRTVHSKHPLIYELCLSIQKILEKYKMFPRLSLSLPQPTPVDPFLDKFYTTYTADNRSNMAFLLEMKISGKFIQNYNKIDSIFVREAWSEEGTVDMKKYLAWVKSAKPTELFFGEPLKAPKKSELGILMKRREKLKNKMLQSQAKKTSEKPIQQLDSYILTDDKEEA